MPSTRLLLKSTSPLSAIQTRNASSKHPKDFVAPSQSELEELRERVQEFTRREIPEELAAKTDKSNAFPNELWEKMGEAGFLGVGCYGGIVILVTYMECGANLWVIDNRR